MTTAYSTLLGLALPVQGELSGTWGDTVNAYITQYLDSAVAGVQTLSTDASVTLTKTTGTALNGTSAQYAILNCTGARTVLRTITVPAASKTYIVINATTGGFGVKVVGAGPTTGVTVAAGTQTILVWNGSDFIVMGTASTAGLTPVANGGTGSDNAANARTALGAAASGPIASSGITGAAVAGPLASSGITGAAVAGPLASSGITGAAASGANNDITSLTALTSINGGQLGGLRNRIINGNFGINQRAYVSGAAVGAGLYGHDRWKMAASADTYTFSTTANVTTITISAGKVLQQVIEGLNLESGTYTLSWTGTAQGKIGAGSYGASGVTGSITGGTNTTIEFGPGTVSKIQLELGSVATTFEQRPYGMELALCQRYFEIISYSSSITTFVCYVLGGGCSGQWWFSTTKRVIPTFAVVSGSWVVSPTIYLTTDAAQASLPANPYNYLLGTSGAIAASASAEL